MLAFEKIYLDFFRISCRKGTRIYFKTSKKIRSDLLPFSLKKDCLLRSKTA